MLLLGIKIKTGENIKLEISAIILARKNSKGIPFKNIINFCGRPLISWSIEQCLKSKKISNVYVSTDGKEIAKISKEFGAEIIMRPEEYATDTSSSESALLHALTEIPSSDLIVFPQATSPVREPGDFDDAITEMKNNNYDSLFSATLVSDYCIWKGDKSITYDYTNRGRRQDKEPLFLENGSFYIFRANMFNEKKNRLHGNIGKYIMPFHKSFEIDTLEDLKVCEYYMKNNILGKNNE